MGLRPPFILFVISGVILAVGFWIFRPFSLTPSSVQNGQTANVSVSSAGKTSASPSAGPSESPIEPGFVARIPDPYPFPPEENSTITERTLAALVNILCHSESEAIPSISGSGVVIDPRGVVLTNAHVAQYFLLAENPDAGISCTIRSGAPASPISSAELLFIPPIWIQEHASDITAPQPKGTGAHDYALLRLNQVPEGGLPALPIDTRHGIGFTNDLVFVASYPAEFLGDPEDSALYPISSITDIKELITFGEGTVDLLSMGGIVEVQGGSSGGPVVNAWSHLVGVITTASAGATPAERELRALSLNYIDRDLRTQAGMGLAAMISGDLKERAEEFRTQQAPVLTSLLLEAIK